MTKLEQAWWAWRALSRTEKARFLTLFREHYARQRGMTMRKNGYAAHDVRLSNLMDLTLTEADLQRRRL
jgi:hypothetical protein